MPLPDGEESIVRLYSDHVVIPTRETEVLRHGESIRIVSVATLLTRIRPLY